MSDPFHQFGLGKWIHDNGELGFKPIKAKRWGTHFGVHFTPIIFFFIPVYLIFDGPLFLLYLQVIFVGLSAIPLYYIAKNIFKEKITPFIIVIVYLFFRQLLLGLMHDIHMEMYFPLFLFSSYYFIAIKKRPFLFFSFITLALFIKEDIAMYIFFFGIFLFFKLKEKKYGFVTSIYSLLFFVLAMGIIIPFFRSQVGAEGSYVYDHFGGNIIQIIENILVHPGVLFESVNMEFFLTKFSNIILPLLLLPFFSIYTILAFPPLFVAIMSKNPQHYSFGIHYSATLLPFIFLSLTYGLKNVKDFFQKIKMGKFIKLFLVILILLLFINLANSNFWRIVKPSKYKALKDYKHVAKIIDQIPRKASVAALSSLIPHIPKRKNIYMLPETGEAEFILVHSGINLWPYKEEEFLNFLNRIENEKRYSRIYQHGDIKLFKKRR